MNIETIIFGVVIGIVVEFFALSWAYFEVQIEGDKSWATGLPCWRRKYSWFSKEITGYHVSLLGLFVAIILLTTAIIAIACIVSNKIEIFIAILNIIKLIVAVLLSILILGTMHEDFLWGMLNPSEKYGLKGFTKKYPEVGETIFIWIVPIDYILMTSVSFAVTYFIGGIMIALWIVIYVTMLAITLLIAAKRYENDLKKSTIK